MELFGTVCSSLWKSHFDCRFVSAMAEENGKDIAEVITDPVEEVVEVYIPACCVSCMASFFWTCLQLSSSDKREWLLSLLINFNTLLGRRNKAAVVCAKNPKAILKAIQNSMFVRGFPTYSSIFCRSYFFRWLWNITFVWQSQSLENSSCVHALPVLCGVSLR